MEMFAGRRSVSEAAVRFAKHYTEVKETMMSDGREEREERERRREQERRESSEDRLDRYPSDEWEQERRDS